MGSCLLHNETIAYALYGIDAFAARAKFFAELEYVDVHRPLNDVRSFAPDTVQQGLARIDSSGMGRKKIEQFKFLSASTTRLCPCRMN